ncbi:MAG: TRAP transporter large permease subunit [Desulfotomaculales bacterium]
MVLTGPALFFLHLGLGTASAGEHQQNKTMEEFKKRLEAKAGDRITVENYPASQLGTAAQMIQGLQDGSVQGVLLPSGYYGSVVPQISVIDLPHHLTTFFSSFNALQFLLFLNILLLLVGCFFEPSAAILILAPLLLPAAKHLGIDPLHLGIVFTVNLAIGMFTPPFGLNIFVSQSILKKSMGEISTGVLPFIVLYILALCVITYIPSLSLVLPRLLYGIS